MRIFRKRVRSIGPGRVLSVNPGTRDRVCVEHDDGETRYYFATDSKAKPGQSVRKGSVLGKV